MRDAALHDALAGLFSYPREDYVLRARDCAGRVPAPAREPLARFLDRCAGMSVEDLQEAYTRSFDMDPACSLEVGWHLHGENYARGEYLVGMRRALREHGLGETTELPDHLTHVLPVLGRTPGEAGERLSGECAKALGKVSGSLQGQASPFEDLVHAALAVVGNGKEAARG